VDLPQARACPSAEEAAELKAPQASDQELWEDPEILELVAGLQARHRLVQEGGGEDA